MKRRIITGTAALILLLQLLSGAALADEVTYDHVDVRAAGSVTITTETLDESTGKKSEKTEVIAVEVSDITVAVDGRNVPMSKRTKSESKLYPYEYQSARKMKIKSDAKISVKCTIAFVYDGKQESVTDTFAFLPSDSNCEGRPKGVDLTVTSEKLKSVIIKAVATPVPATPVPTTPVPATPVPATPVPATPVPATPVPATPVPATPVPATPVPATPVPATPVPATPVPATPVPATPVPATPVPATPVPATPTPPLIMPTATPRITPWIIPQTGETADIWLVMLVLTGICAAAGIALLSIKRANRK